MFNLADVTLVLVTDAKILIKADMEAKERIKVAYNYLRNHGIVHTQQERQPSLPALPGQARGHHPPLPRAGLDMPGLHIGKGYKSNNIKRLFFTNP